jgi:hypothetical protein
MNSVVSVSRLPPVQPHFSHVQNVVHRVVRHLSHLTALTTDEPVCDGSLLHGFTCFKEVLLVQLLEFFTKRCRCQFFAGDCHQPARMPSRMLPRSFWLFLFLMLIISKRSLVRYSSLTALADPLMWIADYMAVHVSKNELAANSKAETIR